MHNLELFVFDMAGTVVDEGNVVYKTLQKAINQNGYDLALNFVLEHGAGKEKHQAIKDILAQVDPGGSQYSEPIFKNFKELLDIAYDTLIVRTFDGVLELLSHLREKRIKIALNTGYSRPVAEHLLRKMNWKQGVQFDVLVTADDVILGRPHPDMIFEAMKLLNVSDPSKVLKAGDSIIDIKEGLNANCGVTVGVTTGAHNRQQLESAKPSYVLDSLLDLIDLLEA